MYQVMIVDSDGNILGAATDSEALPDVEVMYPGRNLSGVETTYNPELLFNYRDYFYSEGNFIKKPMVPYQITRQYIKPDEYTKLIVPEGTLAFIGGVEYLVDDGIIEYSNPNAGVHLITLTLNGYNDTSVYVEVIGT